MTWKKMWCALASLPLLTANAWAQNAVMRDGHMALECESYRGAGVWSLAQVELDGKTAFRIPVEPMHITLVIHPGFLLVSADRIVYQADPRHSQNAFDESRSAVTYSRYRKWGSDLIQLEAGAKTHVFFPSPHSRAGDLREYPACRSFVDLAFSDFAAAEKQFKQLTAHLPPAREAAWRDFQPKAAAWRALTTKPPLSPEADRERILAENAIKEHNLDSAVSHYESALKIQPTWPAGWFNLAIIYSEQNKYGDATDRMKHYLELMPDAPDAKDARDQMIIWEDKAKR